MKHFVLYLPMYGGMGRTSQGAATNERSSNRMKECTSAGAVLKEHYPNGFALFSYEGDKSQLPHDILPVIMQLVDFPEIPEKILTGPGSARRVRAVPAKQMEIPFFLNGNPVYLERSLPAQHYVQRGEGIVFNGTFEECQVELYKIYSELDTHRDVTYSKDNCAVIEGGMVVASIKISQ